MNSENKNCCRWGSGIAYAIAVLGAILIVVFLDRQLKKYTAPPPVDVGRAEERSKALAEIHNTESDALKNTGWIDAGKGIVRLNIDDAMKLTEEKWKNPAEARADLIKRVDKANPPPPPQAPPPKSLYE
jgi:hypothetical protein